VTLATRAADGGRRESVTSNLGRIVRAQRMGAIGLAALALMIVVALLGPSIAPAGPFELKGDSFQPPSPRNWFGTDNLGRDIFSGVVSGARTSLFVAGASTSLAVLVGGLVGAFGGYYGGRIDDWLMRTSEVFQVLPRLVLALVIVALFGPKMFGLVLVIGLLSWPDIARVLRGQFLTLREREFVVAGRAIGMPDRRLIFREILPNALPPVVVAASLLLANAVLLEAGLAYFGLSDPDLMSWGKMLNNSQLHLRRAPWMVVFPGLAIFITSLGAALCADLINDLLNPRRRNRA
jgi:peptide/nickel transport system permease protein